MAATAVATMGVLSSKQFKCQEKVSFYGATDDSKSISLKCAEPTAVGEQELTLPAITQNRTLLHDGSDLPAAQLSGLDTLGQPGLDSADIFVYADADDSHNTKGVTATDLKTYCNAGNNSLPNGSQNGELAVYDNDLSQWSAHAVGGDASMDKTGQFTVANGAIDNAKISGAAAIEKSKLAALEITDSDVAAGANIAKSKLAALEIADADVQAGANIAKSKLAALEIADSDVAAGANIAKSKLAALEVADADVAAGAAIAGSKVAPDFGAQTVETSGTCQVGATEAFRFGDESDGNWRMAIVAGDFVVQKRETGSWVTKGSFSA
jgi:hypothetical protein